MDQDTFIGTPAEANIYVAHLYGHLEMGHAAMHAPPRHACPVCHLMDTLLESYKRCTAVDIHNMEVPTGRYNTALIDFRRDFWNAAKHLPNYVQMQNGAAKIINIHKYEITQTLAFIDRAIQCIEIGARMTAGDD